MNKMYKFTIEYYYLRHRTGRVNEDFTRTAIAKERIAKVDSSFEDVAKVSFEEMVEDNYY